MKLLKKVEEDNRGIDVSLYGTAIVLILFISFCSIFDYWVLTFAKESVLSRVELYEFNALSANVDYTQAGYKQDFEKFFASAAIEEKVESSFYKYFSDGIRKSTGFVYNVGLVEGQDGINCYPDAKTKKITLESGPIRFQVQKLLKAGNTVPFVSGETRPYTGEVVYSSVNTNIVFLFD